MKSYFLVAVIFFVFFSLFDSCSNSAGNGGASTESTPVTYTITFYANDGSQNSATATQAFTAGKTQNLKTIAELGFLREGFNFAGWGTSSDAVQSSYADAASYTATANESLYALWSSIPVYNVHISSDPNGAVISDPPTATEGALVTLRISPNNFFLLKEIKVASSDGSDISLIQNEDVITFYMPAEDVNVTVSYYPAVKATINNIDQVVSSITQDITIVMTGFVSTSEEIAKIRTAITSSQYMIKLDLRNVLGFTTLPHSSFFDCQKLQAIYLPDTLNSIEESPFTLCSNLRELFIPQSVNSIEADITSYCENLTRIEVDPNNQFFLSEDGVLFNKDKTCLQEYPCGKEGAYSIPNTVLSINKSAFGGRKKISDISFGDKVAHIGMYAFSGSSLTNIIMPDTVTEIGQFAFSSCKDLISITIGNSVSTISANAFFHCSNLKTIKMSNSIVSIEPAAFEKCTSLTKLTIPNSVKQIEQYAFRECSSLQDITFSDSLTSIGKCAFEACGSLCDIILPDSLISIGDGAFSACDIKSIMIPKAVTNIGAGSFSCAMLNNVNVDSNNQSYSSFEGVVFNKDKTALVLYPKGKIGSYTIPDSVITIETAAFSGCENLTSIIIPNSVKSIGYGSFSGCSGLNEINLPNSVKFIGKRAFQSCVGLSSVIIPESVDSIGCQPFYNCGNLVSVEFANSIGWYAIFGGAQEEKQWERKTGGTSVDLSNTAWNASWLKQEYMWYRFEN